ncbi:hypothetical protein CEXT_269911 [Caerostris extrusa]|uniref:Uncharacterized protein n=1 Tax=Caerostris extrusa TaxID=172846 RepID=A0AAV4P1Q5_CAEEX|nr:hypothetical protein CEXT_269911 [Caerostris extrusa]
MCPESADQRNWEIETDECSPEKFGRTAPNRWPSSVRSFNRHPGSIVSMNTIRKEAHLHGFHGRATAFFNHKVQPRCSVNVVQSTSKLDCRSVETDSLE